MADNTAQLDQSGSNFQMVRTWLGPTIGWAMLPVVPEIIATTSTAIVVAPYTSRLLLDGAVKSITLPNCRAWMLAQYQANQASFDRSIWVKDYGYHASSGAPIVITPNGTDLIDKLASFRIIQAGALIRIYPLTDLTGWYVG